jgi:NitT/TauT family transport system substrate-binding protein
MVAYLRGVRAYGAALQGGERDEMTAILAQYTALRDPGLYDRMTLPYLDPNGRIDAATVNELLGWYVARGLVPAAVVPEQAIDARFVELALQRVGRQE